MNDGMIVPVFEKMRMEYSYLGNSGSENVRLVRALNVAPFYYVHLIIRIHSLTMVANQSFIFTLSNTLPTEEDPREFSEDATAAQFLTLPINSSSPAAPVIVTGTATNPGAFLKLNVKASQGSATGLSTLYGEFSGAVLLRRA